MPEIPKGYKQTEVGVIPEEWEVKSLAELGNFKTGPFGTLLKAAEYYASEGIPLVSVGDINDGVLTFGEHTPLVPPQVVRRLPQYVLDAGDIVFGRKGGVDRSALVHADKAGCFLGSDGIRFRLSTEAYAPFITYQLQRNDIRAWLLQHAMGTTMPSMNQGILRRVGLPIPSETEQEAIAAALSDADAWIESLEKLIEKRRAVKHGAMQALLTPPGQPGHQRLPGFTGAWEVKRLGALFSFSGGVSASRAQLSHTGHCYLHYGDIHTRSSTQINVDSEFAIIPKLDISLGQIPPTALLNDGDVVFVDASEDEEGASKHVVVVNPRGVPYIAGLHTIVAKAMNNDLDQAYRRFCFQTQSIRAQFRFYTVGTKVSGISKGNITKIELCFPQRDEQSAIAGVLSDLDAEVAALEAKLAKARQIKQGMMQELLTGRVRLV